MRKELSVNDDALYFNGSNVIDVTISGTDNTIIHAAGRGVYKGQYFCAAKSCFFATSGEGPAIARAITDRITILEIYRDRYSKT